MEILINIRVWLIYRYDCNVLESFKKGYINKDYVIEKTDIFIHLFKWLIHYFLKYLDYLLQERFAW